MKKLLLPTSVLSAFFFFASCQNSPPAQTEMLNEAKPAIKASPLATDTQKTEVVTPTSGTVGKDSSETKKDSTGVHQHMEAPQHKAPGQDQIDSIKKAKMKNKK